VKLRGAGVDRVDKKSASGQETISLQSNL
jgi:hypothetical protein